jgi:hypothetical protein
MTSGHPVFPKVHLIQGELVVNTLLFHFLARRGAGFVPAAALSIIVSKAAYYGAKYLLLRAAFLGGGLVSTPWSYQLATLAGILLVGGAIWYGRGRGGLFGGATTTQPRGRS